MVQISPVPVNSHTDAQMARAYTETEGSSGPCLPISHALEVVSTYSGLVPTPSNPAFLARVPVMDRGWARSWLRVSTH